MVCQQSQRHVSLLQQYVGAELHEEPPRLPLPQLLWPAQDKPLIAGPMIGNTSEAVVPPQ